mmetsp:Transcript_14593/g.39044  ORF Transcript_14593/g.39044 Transcript_14593/m.39044 type:complete len:206 (-) Transcript_14593:360-977(-)
MLGKVFLYAWKSKRRKDAGKRNCCSALDIIIEGAALVLIFGEQPRSIGLSEIFKLNQRARRETLLHRLDEFVDKLVVIFAANAVHVEATIVRIIAHSRSVASGIELNGKCVPGIDSTAAVVEQKFTNGNAHSVTAEIAQSENSFTVGDDDDAHVIFRPIVQHSQDGSFVLVRYVHPPRGLKDVSPVLTSRADDGRVDQRHGLHDV